MFAAGGVSSSIGRAFLLVGIIGSAPGAITFLRLITGGDVARPLAAKVQAAMFVICVVFLALCVRSFREAKARRLATAGAA